jgi:hypothetical protein
MLFPTCPGQIDSGMQRTPKTVIGIDAGCSYTAEHFDIMTGVNKCVAQQNRVLTCSA